jgi:hypothetical protein
MAVELTEAEQNAVRYLRNAIAVEEAKITEAIARKEVLQQAAWSIESILERGAQARAEEEK